MTETEKVYVAFGKDNEFIVYSHDFDKLTEFLLKGGSKCYFRIYNVLKIDDVCVLVE
jgi:hypothetical protein